LQPIDRDNLPVSRHFWLLGAFGLLHGAKEYVDLLPLAGTAVGLANALLLAVSFLALFEFARRIAADLGRSRAAHWAPLTAARIYIPVAAIALFLAAVSADRAAGLSAAARYLLGFPGALVAGLVLAQTFRANKTASAVLGGAFMAYALLGGLITPAVPGWPAWLPTQEGFLNGIGMPVQLFRALCAFAAMAALVWLVRRHAGRTLAQERQSAAKLHDLAASLEQRAEERAVSLAESMTALRREREFAQTLIEAAPVIVLLLSPRGAVRHVNPYFERLTGYRLDEIAGKDWFDSFLPARDRERIRAVFSGAAQGSPTRGNVNPIVTRSGEEREIEWSDAVIRDEAGQIVSLLAIGHDITARRQTEAKLEASQRRIAEILGSISDGFFTLNQEWVYTYINEKAANFVGKTADQLLNRRIWDVFPDAENSLWHQRYQQVMRTRQRLEFDDYYPESDRWYAGTVFPYEDGISVYFHDVTDRRQTEQKLRHREEMLREVVALSNIGIFDHDQRTDSIYWSPEQRRNYGWGADEAVTLSKFLECLHPEDAERVFAAVQRAHNPASDGRFDIEHRIIRRDGATRWLSTRSQTIFEGKGDAARPIRTIGAVVDITDRMAADQALRSSRAQLLEAQQMARIGSWELDLVGGRLDWSDEIFRIFEIDKERFGASYEAFLAAVHPEDRDAVNKAYTESVASRTPYQITHRLSMPEGRIKWVEERCKTDYGSDGAPLRSRGTVQDITERVLADEALRRSLVEKETLLREIHHRVKNNLQIISSLLYFQAKKVKAPEDMAVITDSRDRLRAMILVHEKLYRSKDLSRVDFGDYLRTLVAQLAESYAPRDGQVETRVEAGDQALPIELAQPCGMIVSELLINAFKYAFPDGRRGEVALRVASKDGRLAVTVSDDGVGLPEGFAPETAGSFGWQLINNLSLQIGATIAVARDRGTAVTVSFPYSETPS
jgi:PAS domain S-box-containing protein